MRALAAGLALVAGAAFAQDSDRDSRALFDRLDANHDGYLTPDELSAPAALENNWLAVDRNNDGRISREEFTIVRRLANTQQPRQDSAAGAGASAPPPKASERP